MLFGKSRDALAVIHRLAGRGVVEIDLSSPECPMWNNKKGLAVRQELFAGRRAAVLDKGRLLFHAVRRHSWHSWVVFSEIREFLFAACDIPNAESIGAPSGEDHFLVGADGEMGNRSFVLAERSD